MAVKVTSNLDKVITTHDKERIKESCYYCGEPAQDKDDDKPVCNECLCKLQEF